MRTALKALIKLAMDAGCTDESLVRELKEAATAIQTGNFFSLWR